MIRIALIVCIAMAILAPLGFVGDRLFALNTQDEPRQEKGKEAPPEMQAPKRPAELDKLDPLVGEWEYEMEMSGPGMPAPEKMKGRSRAAWDADRWVLVEHVEGDMGPMGQFRGINLTTYSVPEKKYITTWIDNMGSHATGTMVYDEATKTWRGRGEGKNLITGQKTTGGGTHKFVNADTIEWTGKEMDATGKVMMEMKGTSKRVK